VRCKLPTYEYQCTDCSNTFERRQRFDEEPIANCPKCAGKARRVIHSVPILFKGSGFYCTDHGRALRDDPGRKNGEKEPEAELKTEVKSEPKTQTTTAPKLEDGG
jgi:putative FmdB family regulatory protein